MMFARKPFLRGALASVFTLHAARAMPHTAVTIAAARGTFAASAPSVWQQRNLALRGGSEAKAGDAVPQVVFIVMVIVIVIVLVKVIFISYSWSGRVQGSRPRRFHRRRQPFHMEGRLDVRPLQGKACRCLLPAGRLYANLFVDAPPRLRVRL
jgi:hypothetical protein